MATPCRVIIDEPASGAWNMALDEALLETVAKESCEQATLRFYQWKEPTLSLGYFQSHEDRQDHKASNGLNLVRRSSGGGALIHDQELTYSLALPASHPMSQDAVALTCLAHRALREALIELGADGDYLTLCEPAIEPSSSSEPFLCFQRRAKGDLLARLSSETLLDQSESESGKKSPWCKICGSAQRKRRGAVLQHGGVLLALSKAAPELDGIKELSNLQISVENLTPIWSRNLLQALDLEALDENPNQEERALAKKLEVNRFSSPDWIERR